MLAALYYFSQFILTPFELLWNHLFSLNIDLKYYKKIIVLDTIGGSGKTTLANAICWGYGKFYTVKHIKIDDCKFGENWKRFTPDEFEANLNREIEKSNGHYVLEGTYHDPRLDRQRELLDKLIKDADLVIWYDLPKYVALWRKLFRSYKRYLGVTEQGTAPETFENVKAMVKKGYYTFDDRYKIMDDYLEHRPNVVRVCWPYFYGGFTN